MHTHKFITLTQTFQEKKRLTLKNLAFAFLTYLLADRLPLNQSKFEALFCTRFHNQKRVFQILKDPFSFSGRLGLDVLFSNHYGC